MQAAANAGVKTYGYLFTQPSPSFIPPFLGGKLFICDILHFLTSDIVFHSAEIPLVYGQPQEPTPSALTLSNMMVDYWISFAATLTPNDGRGGQRMSPSRASAFITNTAEGATWNQFTPQSQVSSLCGSEILYID